METSIIRSNKAFFVSERNELIQEFYLPKIEDFEALSLAVISDALGRKLASYDECMRLTFKDFHTIVANLGVFSRVCCYIREGYYIAGLTIKMLSGQTENGSFTSEQFHKKTKEIFLAERGHGRVVKYHESFSLDLMKRALKFFFHQNVIENTPEGLYRVTNATIIDELLAKYEDDLIEHIRFSFRE